MNSKEDSVSYSYTTICRLCMQRDGFMLGIFNHIQGKEKSIYKKIMDCTALEISFGDGLPNSICHRCLYKIEFCLEFRQQCCVSDATLRQINGISKQNNYELNNHHHHHHITKTPQPQPPQQQDSSSNVVMVVDPNVLDYESDYDSEHSDIIDKNVFMCKYCDQAFTDKAECHAHETHNHDPAIPYVCNLCGDGGGTTTNFTDRIQFSAHLKTVHANDKPYQCPQCDKAFARRSDLRKHTIVHTGIKPYTCHICFKSFSRNTNLSKHLRIHKSPKPFVCTSCPKTFLSKVDLTRHAVLHTGVKPFKCNYCPLGFERKDKLLRHQKRHFPTSGDCINDKTNELRRMREHLGFLNNDTTVMQPTIQQQQQQEEDAPPSQKSDESENLVVTVDPFQNIEEINTEPDLPPSICPEVKEEEEDGVMGDDSEERRRDDAINDSAMLMEVPDVPSLLPETTITPIIPSSSPLITTPQPLLQQHDAAATYECQMCQRQFAAFDQLHLHMAVHTTTTTTKSNRPFACMQCPKAFMRKRELDRHIATHTGQKPFKCSYCEKRFGRKDKLIRHQRIHDANNRVLHNCEVCGAQFQRKDGLAHHMRTTHHITNNEQQGEQEEQEQAQEREQEKVVD